MIKLANFDRLILIDKIYWNPISLYWEMKTLIKSRIDIERLNFETMKTEIIQYDPEFLNIEIFLKFNYREYINKQKDSKEKILNEEEFDIIHQAHNCVFYFDKYSNFTKEEVEILEKRENYNFNHIKKLKINDEHYNFHKYNFTKKENFNSIDLAYEYIADKLKNNKIKIKN